MKLKCKLLFVVFVSIQFTSFAAMTNAAASEGITDPNTQYSIGCDLHQQGYANEAVRWCRLAAEQGHKLAQLTLGDCYSDGDGVPKDYTKAIEWFSRSAEQNLPEAQFALGGCYHNGNGVLQDYKMAVKWYRRAAEQGHVNAQFNLASLYFNGLGVPQDYREAVKWYRRVAEQGYLKAQRYLGRIYSEGVAAPQDYKEALKWIRLAAEQGDPEEQNNLGICYFNGQGTLEDYVEAYAWWSIAAMNGSTEGKDNRDGVRRKMTESQIAAGQARSKELMAVIDRKKQIAKLPADQAPTADIAPSGYGSGLLVKGGYVVTCWHVVDKAQKISVSCQGKDFFASVVHKDAGNDIAILRVDSTDAGAALSFADSVKLGAQVFTMGFPHPELQGSDVKFTTGSISGLTGPGNTPVYYQISAPLQSGNSGGPLFDEYGNLVGIVAAKLDSLKMLAATGDLTQNVNYAIKSDYLVPLLKTVDGIKIQPSQTKTVNLLSLVEELKKSVVMIKVY